jgi:hypothetical protein
MKPSSGPRKTAELSYSIHQQLNMYSLAASIAGVGMVASAQSSRLSKATGFSPMLWLFLLANEHKHGTVRRSHCHRKPKSR